MGKEQLKLYNKEKLIDIIEKLSIEFAIKNQQYEYIRHNDYSNELQQRIEKAIENIENYFKEYYISNYDENEIERELLNDLLNILEGRSDE